MRETLPYDGIVHAVNFPRKICSNSLDLHIFSVFHIKIRFPISFFIPRINFRAHAVACAFALLQFKHGKYVQINCGVIMCAKRADYAHNLYSHSVKWSWTIRLVCSGFARLFCLVSSLVMAVTVANRTGKWINIFVVPSDHCVCVCVCVSWRHAHVLLCLDEIKFDLDFCVFVCLLVRRIISLLSFYPFA